jgi:hypothetical protein
MKPRTACPQLGEQSGSDLSGITLIVKEHVLQSRGHFWNKDHATESACIHISNAFRHAQYALTTCVMTEGFYSDILVNITAMAENLLEYVDYRL